MPDDKAKAPNPATASVLTAAIISGAVIIAAIGTFLPDLIGLEGTPAIVLRLVFYAVAAVDVAVAFDADGQLLSAAPLTRSSRISRTRLCAMIGP